jgi:hypothetical protein
MQGSPAFPEYPDSNKQLVPTGSAHSPLRKRHVTDILCLLVFAALWVYSIYSFIYGISNGSLSKISRPYDSDGNPCGSTGVAYHMPYLFFNVQTVASSNLESHAVCVDRCPAGVNDRVNYLPTANTPAGTNLYLTETSALWDRFCLPTDEAKYQNMVSAFFGVNWETIYESINHYITLILIFVGISALVSYIYSKMLGFCSTVIIYSSLVMLFVGLITMSIVSWSNYNAIMDQRNEAPDEERGYVEDSAKTYKWFAIGCWILTGILLLLVILLFDRIQIAVRVIQAAGDFIVEVPQITFVPLVLYFFLIGYFFFWSYTMLYVYSSGKEVHYSDQPYGTIKLSDDQK